MYWTVLFRGGGQKRLRPQNDRYGYFCRVVHHTIPLGHKWKACWHKMSPLADMRIVLSGSGSIFVPHQILEYFEANCGPWGNNSTSINIIMMKNRSTKVFYEDLWKHYLLFWYLFVSSILSVWFRKCAAKNSYVCVWPSSAPACPFHSNFSSLLQHILTKKMF